MEWIIFLVIFVCLTYLLLKIKVLQKDLYNSRKVLEALMWTLLQKGTFEMEEMYESIEVALGKVKPRTGTRDDYLTIFGHDMVKIWTLLGFEDSVPYYKRQDKENS